MDSVSWAACKQFTCCRGGSDWWLCVLSFLRFAYIIYIYIYIPGCALVVGQPSTKIFLVFLKVDWNNYHFITGRDLANESIVLGEICMWRNFDAWCEYSFFGCVFPFCGECKVVKFHCAQVWRCVTMHSSSAGPPPQAPDESVPRRTFNESPTMCLMKCQKECQIHMPEWMPEMPDRMLE